MEEREGEKEKENLSCGKLGGDRKLQVHTVRPFCTAQKLFTAMRICRYQYTNQGTDTTNMCGLNQFYIELLCKMTDVHIARLAKKDQAWKSIHLLFIAQNRRY